MRVIDLEIDPTTRVVDVLVVLLMIIGVFGPLLFIRSWVEAIGQWIERDHPSIVEWVAKAHQRSLARLVLNHWVARGLMVQVLLSFLIWLTSIMPLIIVVFLGPVVGVILLANILDLDQELPEALHLPHLGARRVIAFFAVVIILFLMIIGS